MLKKFGILSFFTFLNFCSGFETNFRLENNKVFSLANNESYIINSFNSSNDVCQTLCLFDNKEPTFILSNTLREPDNVSLVFNK